MTSRRDIDWLRGEIDDLFSELWQIPRFAARGSFRPQIDCYRTEDPPETWTHYETDPSDGSPAPIPFDFFWVRLPDEVPELIADHGLMLPRLLAALAAEA